MHKHHSPFTLNVSINRKKEYLSNGFLFLIIMSKDQVLQKSVLDDKNHIH